MVASASLALDCDGFGMLFQVPPNVEPPWRNDRASVRRDSLNIRWTIPHSEPPVLYVELEHDEGFGGNFTTTLAIRRLRDGNIFRNMFDCFSHAAYS